MGRSVALAFGKQGAKVVLAARSKEEIDHLAEQLRALRKDVIAIPTDISDEDQVNRLVDSFPEEARAKIRYAHRAARCRISEEDGRLTVRFAEPQEAVAPGQSVVLYDGETVLGGGIIQEVQVGNN